MRHVVYDTTAAATWIGWGALGLVWATGALWAGRHGAEPVQEWIRDELPGQRRAPLVDALARASAEERAVVVNGLAILERLLATDSPDSR